MNQANTDPIAIYQSPTGTVDVRLDGDTVWLSLQQIADLFGRDKSVISRHLRNVFNEGELERPSVVAKNATTAADGKTYQVEFFNLDAILSVGYRVNSREGTRFRQWATRLLREHLTLGYTVNRQRFEDNAAELEAALNLIRKAAQTLELSADTGRGLVDIVTPSCPAAGRLGNRAKKKCSFASSSTCWLRVAWRYRQKLLIKTPLNA